MQRLALFYVSCSANPQQHFKRDVSYILKDKYNMMEVNEVQQIQRPKSSSSSIYAQPCMTNLTFYFEQRGHFLNTETAMFMHKLTYLLSRFQSAKALISMIIAYLSLKDKKSSFFCKVRKEKQSCVRKQGRRFFPLSLTLICLHP